MTVTGFPHSDIHGSILACSSPWLFAAYRVLRRLLAPRHPPYALSSLTFSAAKAHTFMHVFSYWYFSLISFNVFALIRGCQSPSSGDWSFFFCEVFKVQNNGGDEEDRTPDPLLAGQVLSQLSYAPTNELYAMIDNGGPRWT